MRALNGYQLSEGKPRVNARGGWGALLLTALVCVLFSAGCDNLSDERYRDDYVVEGYLVANETLSQVRVTRTEPLDGTWDIFSNAVSDALVTVSLLDDDGNAVLTSAYREDPNWPGIYRSTTDHVVEGGRRYRLEARPPNSDEVITAETVVPRPFSTLRRTEHSLPYRCDEQFEWVLTGIERDDEKQITYIMTAEAQEPTYDNLIAFYRRLIEEGATIEDFVRNSSPPVNEANFRNDDGTITLRLPWISITFYGPSLITISAIDDNLYDFVRSHSGQQGGGLAPGEIPNVIEHVENGRGVFGSMSRVREMVDVDAPGCAP